MQDYKKGISSLAVRIRWISVQCYEIVLPNGKVIVTDPFYWDASHYDGLTELTANQKWKKRYMPSADFPWKSLRERIILS